MRTDDLDFLRDGDPIASMPEIALDDHERLYREIISAAPGAARSRPSRRSTRSGRSRRTFLGRRPALLAAVAVAAIAVVLIGVSGFRHHGVETATAAEVIAKMRTALSQARSVSGHLDYRVDLTAADGRKDTVGSQIDFLTTASGNQRLVETVDSFGVPYSPKWVGPSGGISFPTSVDWAVPDYFSWPIAIKGPGAELLKPGEEFDVSKTGLAHLIMYKTKVTKIYNAKEDRLMEIVQGKAVPSFAREVNVTYPESSDPGRSLGEAGLPLNPGAMVIAALAENSGAIPIEVVEYGGRPAWKMSFSHTEDYPDTVTHLNAFLTSGPATPHTTSEEFIVDCQTGVLVHETYTLTDNGVTTAVGEMKLSDLRIDAPIANGAFAIKPPAGMPRVHYRWQGGRCTLAEAARGLGSRLPLPTAIPGGFRLATVSRVPFQPTDSRDWGLDHKPDVVTLLYRRGIDSFRVIVASAAWLKEAGPYGEIPDRSYDEIRPLTTQVTKGTFANTTVKTWLDPTDGVVLTAYGKQIGGNIFSNSQIGVIISGSLTRAEALMIANWLKK